MDDILRIELDEDFHRHTIRSITSHLYTAAPIAFPPGTKAEVLEKNIKLSRLYEENKEAFEAVIRAAYELGKEVGAFYACQFAVNKRECDEEKPEENV